MKKLFFLFAVVVALCSCEITKTPRVSISHSVDENNKITFVASHENAIIFVWWVNDQFINQSDIGFDTLEYQGVPGNSYVAKLRYYDYDYKTYYAKDSVYIP